MSKKNTNKSFFKKNIKRLSTELKLIVLKRHNFEETLSINITPLRVLVLFLVFAILIVGITFTTLSLSSLKSYIPGCIDQNIRKDLVNYLMKVDSLDKNVHDNQIFLDSINKVVSGENSTSSGNKKNKPIDSTFQNTRSTAIDNLNKPLSKEEKNLRNFIEKHEGSFKQSYTHRKQTSIGDYEFFPPLQANIIENYSLANNKLWIKLEGNSKSKLRAILDGIIISIEKDAETLSSTIIIQHDNNIISIYKNCVNVLKKVGNYVNTGDIIAEGLAINKHYKKYIFNFQLWYSGSSVNPNDFIKFN